MNGGGKRREEVSPSIAGTVGTQEQRHGTSQMETVYKGDVFVRVVREAARCILCRACITF